MIPIVITDNTIIKKYAKDVIKFIAQHKRNGTKLLKEISQTILEISEHKITFFNLLTMNSRDLKEKVKPLYDKYKTDATSSSYFARKDILLKNTNKTSEEKRELIHLRCITFDILKDIYDSFFYENGLSFMETLGITVCPYCNRNYIYNTKSLRTSEFDHFFPKEKYPILALCFYNLIPSCKTCNHIKSDEIYDELLNPYDNKLEYDTFLFSAKPVEYAKFKLELKAKDKNFAGSAKVLNEKLQLKDLYDYHSYIPNELYMKSVLLNESYLSQLKTDLQNLGLTNSADIKRLILGNYGDDTDLLKKTLSKVTKDCAIQFGLLQRI